MDFLIKILVHIHFKGADPFIVQSREASGRCSVTYVFKVNSCLLLPQSLTMKATQSCLTVCNPMDYTVHGILQSRILEWIAFPFSKGSSQPRDRTRVSSFKVDSLPTEPQGKPKNYGVGSLSLLQGIFPIQELNWGLLRCRQILYQLSYQGSPLKSLSIVYCHEKYIVIIQPNLLLHHERASEIHHFK